MSTQLAKKVTEQTHMDRAFKLAGEGFDLEILTEVIPSAAVVI